MKVDRDEGIAGLGLWYNWTSNTIDSAADDGSDRTPVRSPSGES